MGERDRRADPGLPPPGNGENWFASVLRRWAERWQYDRRFFAVSFASVAAIFVAFGVWIYSVDRAELLNHQYALLDSLALDESNDLDVWREERIDDLERITRDPAAARGAADYLRGADSGERWSTFLRESGELLVHERTEAVFLLDRQGIARFIQGRGVERGARMPKEIALASRSSGPILFAVGEGEGVRVRVVAPLRNGRGRIVGYVGLQINPQRDLAAFQIVNVRFGHSLAEVLVVSGQRVISPNAPVHPYMGFTERKPLRNGFFQAIDEDGRTMIAKELVDPGAPWSVVARLEAGAFNAALDTLTLWALSILFVFLATTSGLTYMVWKWGETRRKLRESAALRELALMERRFDYLAKYANDAILLIDAERRILEVNDRAVEFYGYSREQLKKLDMAALRAPSQLQFFAHDWSEVFHHDSLVYETIHRSREGREFPVEVSARRIDSGGERYYQLIIRDISARKKAERLLRRQSELYAALSRANEAMARHSEASQLLPAICRIAVDVGGFSEAYVAMADRGGGLSLIARFGALAVTASDVQLSKESPGPLMAAFREGRPVVVNDYGGDAQPKDIEAAASRYGIGSAAAFPLRSDNHVVGVLGVAAREPRAFDEGQVQLLQDLALDVSLALERIERERQRRDSERLKSESEIRYRTLFEKMGSGVMVLVHEPEGDRFVVKEINAALERIESLRRTAVVGRPVAEATPWAKVCLLPVAHRVWRSGEPESIAADCQAGRRGWRDSYVYRLPTEELVVVVDDVTERVEAEEALRRSEERLALVLQGTNDAYWDFNFESGEVYYSERFAALFGYRRDELDETFEGWQRLVHPNDLIDVQRTLADHLAGKTPEFLSEHRMRHKERGYLWVRARGRVVRRADDGRPLRMAGTHTDISGQRTAEEQLRQWATVFEQSREAIIITDAQKRILSVNQAFTEITGYSADEVRGRDPSLLSSGVHDRAFYQNLWASIEQTGHWQGEVQDRRKNGEIFPLWLAITQARDAQGKVQSYIAICSDISERKESEERIHYLAYHDSLTGLPNRSLFADRLEFALAHAKRNAFHAAVLFLDLDRFKYVNDSLGHATGDKLLKLVAQRLVASVRNEDTVCRQGGDEFLVLLAELSTPQDSMSVARKVVDELGRPYMLDDVEVRITPSIGIAVFPQDGLDPDTLIRNADAAMYSAKERGRDNFQYFREELNARARNHLSLETGLRRAIDEGDFVLHYQPQLALESGALVGAEALLRWRLENKLVPPSQFIPFAEETGLILPIGDWVMREARRQQAVWEAAGLPPLQLAVNVSASQFRQKDWAARVSELIGNYVSRGRIEIELTESVLMQEAEASVTILRALKELGIALAIDDFGTGYSSLSYLRRFPVDHLKVDQSFVHDLERDPVDRAVTEAIINLARSLGIRVIAEGVEDAEEMRLLRIRHCDEVQGRYLSPPLSAQDFERWWRQHDKR